MNKDFITALAFALIVYFGVSYFFPQKTIENNQQQVITQTQTEQTQNTALAVPTQNTNQSASLVQTQNAIAQEEKTFTIEKASADVTFTNKGASIKSFVYKDAHTNLDLTAFSSEGYFSTLPTVHFEKSNQTENGADITFTAKLTDNLEMLKSYYISPDGKLGNLKITFINNSDQNLTIPDFFVNLGAGLNTVKSEMSENAVNLRAICSIQEKGKKKLSVNKITKKIAQNSNKLADECQDWLWAGIDNRYFLAVLIPTNWKGVSDGFKFDEQYIYSYPSFYGLFGNKAVSGPDLKVLIPAQIPAGQKVEYNSDFYIGPKDLNLLTELPYNLQRSIQFGFFGQLGKWARGLLDWLYKYTNNYGYAIILMTFMIQLVLLPLTYKQLKSSAVMQKIQPQMKVIQEKYKNDPMQAQKEMVTLYKKYGANPLSGCLPIFIQLPIFLALFNALRTSWALHGSPFIWWITDLSAKDPFYVLPISMGIMMFIQQKLTMPDVAKDNPSMAMMKWMPVFMTVIFLNFPAGLTLYWFISNCINFVINLVLKKKLATI